MKAGIDVSTPERGFQAGGNEKPPQIAQHPAGLWEGAPSPDPPPRLRSRARRGRTEEAIEELGGGEGGGEDNYCFNWGKPFQRLNLKLGV